MDSLTPVLKVVAWLFSGILTWAWISYCVSKQRPERLNVVERWHVLVISLVTGPFTIIIASLALILTGLKPMFGFKFMK